MNTHAEEVPAAAGRLRGKSVLITGAGSGIGRAIAVLFAGEGARVFCVDIADEVHATVQDITAAGGSALSWICDVRDEVQVSALARAVHEQWGTLDILVANAGINPIVERSDEIQPELWDRVMDVNVAGIFWCCKHLAPMMRAQRRGSIVALASVSGMIGWGGSAAYTASKGAVIALTRALAMEYAPDQVRVNCLCPGSIWTPMVAVQFEGLPDREARLQRTAALHPLGRIGTADDVAYGAL
ncbi:MAG TPA: SDR family NAD(P)-dependent oxidoreductase, partial [Chloroflexota bacterium]|nr:SDR family NAD(P)-dependent oxidoreductase [Chloroflexota bacterium]